MPAGQHVRAGDDRQMRQQVAAHADGQADRSWRCERNGVGVGVGVDGRGSSGIAARCGSWPLASATVAAAIAISAGAIL